MNQLNAYTYFSHSDNVHSQLKHSLAQSLFIKSHLRISITSISKSRYTFLDVQPSIILVYQLNCFENSKMSNERGILTAHISFHCPSLACHMNVWKASNIYMCVCVCFRLNFCSTDYCLTESYFGFSVDFGQPTLVLAFWPNLAADSRFGFFSEFRSTDSCFGFLTDFGQPTLPQGGTILHNTIDLPQSQVISLKVVFSSLYFFICKFSYMRAWMSDMVIMHHM